MLHTAHEVRTVALRRMGIKLRALVAEMTGIEDLVARVLLAPQPAARRKPPPADTGGTAGRRETPPSTNLI